MNALETVITCIFAYDDALSVLKEPGFLIRPVVYRFSTVCNLRHKVRTISVSVLEAHDACNKQSNSTRDIKCGERLFWSGVVYRTINHSGLKPSSRASTLRSEINRGCDGSAALNNISHTHESVYKSDAGTSPIDPVQNEFTTVTRAKNNKKAGRFGAHECAVTHQQTAKPSKVLIRNAFDILTCVGEDESFSHADENLAVDSDYDHGFQSVHVLDYCDHVAILDGDAVDYSYVRKKGWLSEPDPTLVRHYDEMCFECMTRTYEENHAESNGFTLRCTLADSQDGLRLATESPDTPLDCLIRTVVGLSQGVLVSRKDMKLCGFSHRSPSALDRRKSWVKQKKKRRRQKKRLARALHRFRLGELPVRSDWDVDDCCVPECWLQAGPFTTLAQEHSGGCWKHVENLKPISDNLCECPFVFVRDLKWMPYGGDEFEGVVSEVWRVDYTFIGSTIHPVVHINSRVLSKSDFNWLVWEDAIVGAKRTKLLPRTEATPNIAEGLSPEQFVSAVVQNIPSHNASEPQDFISGGDILQFVSEVVADNTIMPAVTVAAYSSLVRDYGFGGHICQDESGVCGVLSELFYGSCFDEVENMMTTSTGRFVGIESFDYINEDGSAQLLGVVSTIRQTGVVACYDEMRPLYHVTPGLLLSRDYEFLRHVHAVIGAEHKAPFYEHDGGARTPIFERVLAFIFYMAVGTFGGLPYVLGIYAWYVVHCLLTWTSTVWSAAGSHLPGFCANAALDGYDFGFMPSFNAVIKILADRRAECNPDIHVILGPFIHFRIIDGSGDLLEYVDKGPYWWGFLPVGVDIAIWWIFFLPCRVLMVSYVLLLKGVARVNTSLVMTYLMIRANVYIGVDACLKALITAARGIDFMFFHEHPPRFHISSKSIKIRRQRPSVWCVIMRFVLALSLIPGVLSDTDASLYTSVVSWLPHISRVHYALRVGCIVSVLIAYVDEVWDVGRCYRCCSDKPPSFGRYPKFSTVVAWAAVNHAYLEDCVVREGFILHMSLSGPGKPFKEYISLYASNPNDPSFYKRVGFELPKGHFSFWLFVISRAALGFAHAGPQNGLLRVRHEAADFFLMFAYCIGNVRVFYHYVPDFALFFDFMTTLNCVCSGSHFFYVIGGVCLCNAHQVLLASLAKIDGYCYVRFTGLTALHLGAWPTYGSLKPYLHGGYSLVGPKGERHMVDEIPGCSVECDDEELIGGRKDSTTETPTLCLTSISNVGVITDCWLDGDLLMDVVCYAPALTFLCFSFDAFSGLRMVVLAFGIVLWSRGFCRKTIVVAPCGSHGDHRPVHEWVAYFRHMTPIRVENGIGPERGKDMLGWLETSQLTRGATTFGEYILSMCALRGSHDNFIIGPLGGLGICDATYSLSPPQAQLKSFTICPNPDLTGWLINTLARYSMALGDVSTHIQIGYTASSAPRLFNGAPLRYEPREVHTSKGLYCMGSSVETPPTQAQLCNLFPEIETWFSTDTEAPNPELRTDHSVAFKDYDVIVTHGGAGTMQTAVAAGAVAYSCSDLIDRSYADGTCCYFTTDTDLYWLPIIGLLPFRNVCDVIRGSNRPGRMFLTWTRRLCRHTTNVYVHLCMCIIPIRLFVYTGHMSYGTGMTLCVRMLLWGLLVLVGKLVYSLHGGRPKHVFGVLAGLLYAMIIAVGDLARERPITPVALIFPFDFLGRSLCGRVSPLLLKFVVVPFLRITESLFGSFHDRPGFLTVECVLMSKRCFRWVPAYHVRFTDGFTHAGVTVDKDTTQCRYEDDCLGQVTWRFHTKIPTSDFPEIKRRLRHFDGKQYHMGRTCQTALFWSAFEYNDYKSIALLCGLVLCTLALTSILLTVSVICVILFFAVTGQVLSPIAAGTGMLFHAGRVDGPLNWTQVGEFIAPSARTVTEWTTLWHDVTRDVRSKASNLYLNVQRLASFIDNNVPMVRRLKTQWPVATNERLSVFSPEVGIALAETPRFTLTDFDVTLRENVRLLNMAKRRTAPMLILKNKVSRAMRVSADTPTYEDVVGQAAVKAGIDGSMFASKEIMLASLHAYAISKKEFILDDSEVHQLAGVIFRNCPQKFENSQLSDPAYAVREFLKKRKYSAGLDFLSCGVHKRSEIRSGGYFSSVLRAGLQPLITGEWHPGLMHGFAKSQVVDVNKLIANPAKMRTITATTAQNNVSQAVLTKDQNKAKAFGSMNMTGLPTNGFMLGKIFERLEKRKNMYSLDTTAFDRNTPDCILDVVCELRKMGFEKHPHFEVISRHLDCALEQQKTAYIVNLVNLRLDDLRGQLDDRGREVFDAVDSDTWLEIRRIADMVVNETDRYDGGYILKVGGGATGDYNVTFTNSVACEAFVIKTLCAVSNVPVEDFEKHFSFVNLSDDNILATDLDLDIEAVVEYARVAFGLSLRVESTGTDILDQVFLAKHPVDGEVYRADFEAIGVPVPRFAVVHDTERLERSIANHKFADVSKLNRGESAHYRVERLIGHMYNCAHHRDIYEKLVEKSTAIMFTNIRKKHRKGLAFPTYEDVLRVHYDQKRATELETVSRLKFSVGGLAQFEHSFINSRATLMRGVNESGIADLGPMMEYLLLEDTTTPGFFEPFIYYKFWEVHGREPSPPEFQNLVRVSAFSNFCAAAIWMEQTVPTLDVTPAGVKKGVTYHTWRMVCYTILYAYISQSLELLNTFAITRILLYFIQFYRFDLPNVFSALSHVHFLASGGPSPGLSRMMPKDKNYYFKKAALYVARGIPIPEWIEYLPLDVASSFIRRSVDTMGFILSWSPTTPVLVGDRGDATVWEEYALILTQILSADANIVVATAPCGAGKTRYLPEAFLAPLSDLIRPWGRVVVVLPRRSLCQAYIARKRDVLWKQGGVKGQAQHMVCTYGYLSTVTQGGQRPSWLDENTILIFDEAHERSVEWSWFRSHCLTGFKSLLLTATPTQWMHDYPLVEIPVPTPFQVIEENPSMRTMIDEFVVRSKTCSRALLIHPSKEVGAGMARALEAGGYNVTAICAESPDVPDTGHIIATSIADASLTIPGCDLVIDSGESIINRQGTPETVVYDVSTKTQRKGRTGRTCAGVYVSFKTPVRIDYAVCPAVEQVLTGSHLIDDQEVIIRLEPNGSDAYDRFLFFAYWGTDRERALATIYAHCMQRRDKSVYFSYRQLLKNSEQVSYILKALELTNLPSLSEFKELHTAFTTCAPFYSHEGSYTIYLTMANRTLELDANFSKPFPLDE